MRVHVLFLVLAYLKGYSYQQVLPVDEPNIVKSYGLALEAIFGMGIRIQSLLDATEDENFVVSPISATVIIAQLMLGAEGPFQERLFELMSLPNGQAYRSDKLSSYGKTNDSHNLPYSTLHLQLSSLLKALGGHLGEFVLKQSNGLFYNNKIELKSQFVKNIKSFYMTDLYDLDFAGNPKDSQRFINNWGASHTNGLIKNILLNPPNAGTFAIFANSIYFLGEWQTPFSDMLNRNGSFSVTKNKQVNVTYMIGFVEQIYYAETPTYRLIDLPYKNEELGMVIMLPKADQTYDIKEFAKRLKAKDILATISQATRKDVVIKIPKMSLTNRFSILNHLKKYEAYRQEDSNSKIFFEPPVQKDVLTDLQKKVEAFANFSANIHSEIFLTNAAINQSLKINDIVQEIVFSVNEKGTEAAAVTASTIDYIGGSKNFQINRPFVFFIRHKETSAVLFWGTISNPAI